jgi:YHS domain-containing protein
MIEDAVCGHLLSEDAPSYSSQYHAQTFDFCSLRCKSRFELSPEEFLPLGESTAIPQAFLLGAVA